MAGRPRDDLAKKRFGLGKASRFVQRGRLSKWIGAGHRAPLAVISAKRKRRRGFSMGCARPAPGFLRYPRIAGKTRSSNGAGAFATIDSILQSALYEK
jgi:hypothetical protein